ncbi:MAG: TetR/AcrR family transcriptional regulator [Thermoplasmata archaeon]|jgi:AcrR family transcriptional regulator
MNNPKTKRGEKTKRKLLNSAEKVFGEKGYFEASVSEITRRARVSTGTFYIYYDSKLEIFRDLIINLNHELRKTIKIATNNLEKRMDVENKGFRAFFEFLKRHKNLYWIVRQSEHVDRKLFSWYYSKIAEGYIEGLEQAMKKSEFNKYDPELISYALMGIADFVGMRYVLWEDSLDEKKIKQLMDFIFNGLLKK